MKIVRKYGWKPDLPDPRDKLFLKKSVSLPVNIDLRNKMPLIYDQGHLGSCTANSIAAAFEYGQKKQNLEDFIPSRLFIYYNERELEGTIDEDSGAMLRDGIKTIVKQGVCHENICPYVVEKFKDKPSNVAYTDGLEHQCLSYERVSINLNSFKSALQLGYPVIFGFSVPRSFEDFDIAKTGFMKIPGIFEKFIGGHAVVACGYDDNLVSPYNDKIKGHFIVRNSWGDSWGDKGYFYMPYSFFSNKTCEDAWIIKMVEDPLINEDAQQVQNNKIQENAYSTKTVHEKKTIIKQIIKDPRILEELLLDQHFMDIINKYVNKE